MLSIERPVTISRDCLGMGQLRRDHTLNADAGRVDAIIEILAQELIGGERRAGSRGDDVN